MELEKKEKEAKKKKKNKPPAAPAAPVCDPALMYKPDGDKGKDDKGAVLYSQWHDPFYRSVFLT